VRRALALAAVLIAAMPVPANGQQEGVVRLVLLQQTPTATVDRPLQIRVGALNESSTGYQNLQLTVAVYAAVGSRSAYDESLTTGAFSPITAPGPKTLRGSLEAGENRSFPPVEVPMTGLSINALHPVTVELRADGGATPLAILRTSVVFVGPEDPPEVPLNVSLSFVLDQPIRLRPDGVFLDDALERSVAAGGRLATIVGALETVPIPVTLVLSPLLLEELGAMSEGYRVEEGGDLRSVEAGEAGAAAAEHMLDQLGELARHPGTEVIALPYASPSIPSLVDAGLGSDLRIQMQRGAEVVSSMLGVDPSTTVFRPPGSALSGPALDVLDVILNEDGVTEALLVDPEVLEPPIGLNLSPPAAALLRTAAGDIPTIAPDPTLEGRTEAVPQDPALEAMWTVGELAALYFEQPSIDRGAAIVFSEDETPPADLLIPLLRSLRPEIGATWARPMSATRVYFAETSTEDPPLEVRTLQQSSRASSFSPEVTASIDRTDRGFAALQSVEARPDLVAQVRRGILLSESRYLLDHEDLALSFLAAARRTVENEFAKIRPPDVDSEVTLTSRSGSIPLTIRNEADYSVHVRVVLRASGLDFTSGAKRVITLEPPGKQLVFPVLAQKTGSFQVGVQVETPDGFPIASSTIQVRSTAYNRVALIITIGAALFLAAWWGRRFLPRRKS
jgi:hypothetical protein